MVFEPIFIIIKMSSAFFSFFSQYDILFTVYHSKYNVGNRCAEPKWILKMPTLFHAHFHTYHIRERWPSKALFSRHIYVYEIYEIYLSRLSSEWWKSVSNQIKNVNYWETNNYFQISKRINKICIVDDCYFSVTALWLLCNSKFAKFSAALDTTSHHFHTYTCQRAAISPKLISSSCHHHHP